MLSYQQLDAIADANNPLLGVVCALRLAWLLSRKQWAYSARMVVFFGCALIVAYGWEKIDLRLMLWPRIGLDYSTHTAVAVAVTYVIFLFWREARIVWLVWLLAYAVLMLWQRYHSVGDIVTTAVVVVMSLLPCAWGLLVKWPVRLSSGTDTPTV
jgi:hypothetical protein